MTDQSHARGNSAERGYLPPRGSGCGQARNVEQTTAFKGVGLAIYDLFVAETLYREALHANVGKNVEL